jgi:predicted hotdog family 3-hydroxylacyl-ACP dehydratase
MSVRSGCAHGTIAIRRIRCAGGQLRAVHLCEYGAQAMAVHGGLRARGSGGLAKPGLLVALRAVELHVARIDDLPGALECSADMLADGDTGWQYAFRIRHGEQRWPKAVRP